MALANIFRRLRGKIWEFRKGHAQFVKIEKLPKNMLLHACVPKNSIGRKATLEDLDRGQEMFFTILKLSDYYDSLRISIHNSLSEPFYSRYKLRQIHRSAILFFSNTESRDYETSELLNFPSSKKLYSYFGIQFTEKEFKYVLSDCNSKVIFRAFRYTEENEAIENDHNGMITLGKNELFELVRTIGDTAKQMIEFIENIENKRK